MTEVRGRVAQRGNVSLLVVILLPALLAAAGLVLDGGRQLEVRRDATAAAASAAARAATQLSEQEIHGGALDAALAIRRAGAELASQGMAGSVAVSGGEVTVTVEATVDRLILPGAASVSSSATASPVEGVRTGTAP